MSFETAPKPPNSNLILALIAVALVFLGVAQGVNLRQKTEPKTPEESPQPVASSSIPFLIKNQPFRLEVANTPETRRQGLSGRPSLGPRDALLFIFPETENYPGFWMKDMNFAIDIIWLDALGKVVDLTKNLKPDSYPTAVYPTEPIQLVLEVASGTIDQLGLQLGDIIPIPVFEKGL